MFGVVGDAGAVTLFPALAAPLTVTDKTGQGVIVRRGGKVWRVQGRAADGRWVLATCDDAGADIKGAASTWLPAEDAWMVDLLRMVAKDRR